MALKLLAKLKRWYLYWRADETFARYMKTKHVEDGLRWYKTELAHRKAEGMESFPGTDSKGRPLRPTRPRDYRIFAHAFRVFRRGGSKVKPLDFEDSHRGGLGGT